MSLLALLAVTATANVQEPINPPEIPREFRAVWIATVDNIDWPSKRGIPVDQAKAELIRQLDKAVELKLNAIIFQVRPSADALYESRLEPWSEYLTGEQGKAPNPKWDPLQFAIEESHKRGLELHCWFNPYRAQHPAQKGPNHRSHVSRSKPHTTRKYGRYLWMDPGEPDTQKHSLDVMLDAVRRYDIDGVHIDDYFYPYKEKGPDGKLLDFPDDESYAKYRKSGGRLGRDDWRRWSVDTFVERLYKGIKREKPWVKFGISPFGIYRPGIPEGIQAGVDQYADLYADARKWLVEGWCDYYSPQLYWRDSQKPQSYTTLINWWVKQNPKGRNIWIGNFTGQTMTELGNWAVEEIPNQIQITRRTPGATGNIHFSMRAFMKNDKRLSDILREGVYKNAALVPPSPWLDSTPPSKPALAADLTGTAPRFSVTPAEDTKDTAVFAVWARHGNSWSWHVQPGKVPGFSVAQIRNGQQLNAVVVKAVDRNGLESEQIVWTPAAGVR